MLLVIFLGLSLYYAVITAKTMYEAPYVPSTDGSYINQLEVANNILSDAKGTRFDYFVYAPAAVTYGMDYLLWWKGSMVYNNIPVTTKQPGLMYLIMYPNGKDPSAHGYWIQHVVRTKAKLLSSKTYPFGITVEKRMLSSQEEPVDPNYYANIR